MSGGRMGGLFGLSTGLLGLLACEPLPEIDFNQPPVPGTASLTPSEPLTTDMIVLEIGEASDPDGDGLTYRTRWMRNGAIHSVPVDEVSPADTQKGDVWSVEVWATDGQYETEAWSDSVLVLNTAPVLVEASLRPEAPQTEDTLYLDVSGTDDDDDDIEWEVRWTRDGEVLGEWADARSIPASATARGEVWSAEVWPRDDEIRGEGTALETKIDNTAPTLSSVSVSSEPTVDSTVRGALVGADDADGDALSAYLEWYVNGTLLDTVELSGTAADLEHSLVKGDTVQAVGWVNDGFLDSERVASSEVTVLNSAPSSPVVVVDPSEAYEDTVLSCLATGSIDPDGDPLSLEYDWSVEGAWLNLDQATLDGDSFSKGDAVMCSALANDGSAKSETTTSAAIEIQNTPPELTDVDIDQSSASVVDTLTASYTGWSDADGDAESVTLDWYVEGSWVRQASSLSLGSYTKGDEVQVEATPNDGEDDGTSLWSSTLTIANAPPTLSAATLNPSTAYTDDDIKSSASGFYDADGDSASSYSYNWTIGSSTVYTGGAILDSSYTTKGDVVRVEITPNDGEDDGTPATSGALTIRNSTPVADPVLLSSDPVESCSEAELDASTSTDEDGDTLTYSWAATTRPSGSKADTSYFDDVSSPSPTFLIDAEGSWAFSVTVSDGVSSSSESVLFTSTLRATNTDPEADAGAATTTSATAACTSTGYGITCDNCDDQEITLDASGSTDADGDRLAYVWSATSSVGVSWDDTSSDTPTLTVTNLATDYGTTESYEIEVELIASDCAGGSATDTVTLTVECTGI